MLHRLVAIGIGTTLGSLASQTRTPEINHLADDIGQDYELFQSNHPCHPSLVFDNKAGGPYIKHGFGSIGGGHAEAPR